MKKNIYLYAICALMSVLCCYSCYDDKGNYTYRNINEIAISELKESYTMVVGEPITIKPVIESTIHGDEDNYSYEWVVVYLQYKDEYHYDYVWSTLKEWDDFALTLPSGSYKFYYRVTDNTTGVKWLSKTFTIQIINDIAQGFFILSEVNDHGRVDFINYANSQFSPRFDMLTKVGANVPVLEKPIGVACVSDNNSPYMGASGVTGENSYMVGVLTEKGMYRLHPSTFLYEENYEIKQSILLDHLLPSDFYVKKVLRPTASAKDFMLMDNHNNLYFTYPLYNLYATGQVCTNTLSSGGHRMNISEWVVYPDNEYYAVMYDTDNLSFARQTSYSTTVSTYFSTTNETVFEDGKFKFINTGMELVYLHYRARIAGINGIPIYSIQKDTDTGEYYLGCFIVTGVQLFYHRLKNLPEFSDHKEIAMTHNASNRNYANNYLYYRTDTKIYAYDMASQTTQLVFTTDSHEKISCMKFMQLGLTAYAWRDRMMLCTYNPNLPAESCGTLQILATDPVYGTLSPVNHNNEELKWTGFGKIIDLDWKNQ